MQIGEGKAKLGDPLHHTFSTLKGVQYRLKYCPTCLTLHREVIDTEEEHDTKVDL